MKSKDLKGLAPAELENKLGELRAELVKEYAQVATGTIPKSPGKIGHTKKTIARIHTILSKAEEKKQ